MPASFGQQDFVRKYSRASGKGKIYFFDLLRKLSLESCGSLIFLLVGHKALEWVGLGMEPRFIFAVRRRKLQKYWPTVANSTDERCHCKRVF